MGRSNGRGVAVGQPTLLLLTSNQQLHYLIARYAEQSGCRLRGADTVERAITLLRQERPAAVLVHLLGGSEQSWESVRRLKASPAAGGVPIAVISAVADEARARAEGAAYWLWQPVMYADFLAVLAATEVRPQQWS